MSVVPEVDYRGWRARRLLFLLLFLLGGGLASSAEAQTPGLVVSPSPLQVTEGDSASYTVKLATQPAGTVTVSTSASAPPGRSIGLDKTSLSFSTMDWAQAQTVTVSIGEDDTLSSNWTADLTHTASGGGYGSVKAEHEVWIRDNDARNQGTLTVTALAPEVTEGEDARFLLHLDPPPTSTVPIGQVRFYWVGGMASALAGHGERIPKGRSPVLYSAPTTDDNVQEADGSVTATIVHASFDGYQVGSPGSATVVVKDDDGGVDARPRVSITSGGSVTEGGTATFTVTATPPPTVPLKVNLFVENQFEADVLASSDLGVKHVMVGTGGSATYQVATVDDDVEEPLGLVSVFVYPGDGYRARSPQSAHATVYDDDGGPTAPTVEITRVPSRFNSTGSWLVTFTWSDAVTGFVTGDVTVTGGTKGAFTAVSGTTYTLAVTPTSGSDVTVTVAANSATDGLNTTGPASAVSVTATWDVAAPTVEITGVPATIDSTAALTATFTFSEAVTGFVTGDVTVTGGTKGAFTAVSGTEYTLAVTPTGSEAVTVTVAANSATDGLNTGPASAVSATATWDVAAPTVEITGVPATINSTAALTATFTFSKAVTGFVTGDVTVTGGTKGAFTAVSGTEYTLAVTPTSGSAVTVTVAANSATDGSNTGPASAVSATAIWDAVPTVEVTGVPSKINSTAALGVTFTFSEDVTEFVTGDVTVTGGTKGAFTAVSGTEYTLAVTPTGSADVVVTVTADSATDGVNTGPASAVSATAVWDATVPTVEIRGFPAKINSTADFAAIFVFSEDVTEFVAEDVTVTGGTKRGSIGGRGRTYILTVRPTSGSDLTVTVAEDAATDGVNTGPASAVSATAVWDAAVPTVEITGVPPEIDSTAELTATFTFSEDVTEFVTGDVTVSGGSKGTFTAVSGTEYTLAVTPTGSADVTVTVAANSATDGLNTGPASAVSATATWDVGAPTVEIGGVPPKINSTAALTATFTFSEDVTGFVTGDVTVTGGTKGAFTGSGDEYTLVVTPSGSANVVVTVAANSASDGSNTGPPSVVSATATWDAAGAGTSTRSWSRPPARRTWWSRWRRTRRPTAATPARRRRCRPRRSGTRRPPR